MQYHNKEVTYAILHNSFNFPNLGTIGKTLALGSATPNSTHIAKMTIVEQFMEVKISKGPIKKTILIPLTGFEMMVLSEDTKTFTVAASSGAVNLTGSGAPINNTNLQTAPNQTAGNLT